MVWCERGCIQAHSSRRKNAMGATAVGTMRRGRSWASFWFESLVPSIFDPSVFDPSIWVASNFAESIFAGAILVVSILVVSILIAFIKVAGCGERRPQPATP